MDLQRQQMNFMQYAQMPGDAQNGDSVFIQLPGSPVTHEYHRGAADPHGATYSDPWDAFGHEFGETPTSSNIEYKNWKTRSRGIKKYGGKTTTGFASGNTPFGGGV